jgi:ATP-dependent RNA/DNA helicase IGHMBP2
VLFAVSGWEFYSLTPVPVRAFHQPYSLEAQIMGHEGTDIVRDIRAEMNALQRQIARSKTAEARRENRRELRVLRKEARKREEAVVQQIIRSKHVVFCTNVGASSHLLNDVVFDMVIIDEAAQALEASCWIPMMRGRICVLAGDHKQLPPTIKSPAAAEQGLSQTLFERVLTAFEQPNEARGKATSISRMLDVQYRMNKLICEWASVAMYHNQLRSDVSVADHVLDDLPHVETLRSANDMTNAIMLLIDTAGCGMEEAPSRGGSHKNEKEAAVVVAHIEQLLQTGLREEEIAVITPYNGQKELLQEYLQERHPRLDIKSVDGFQGGEREAVVMSLVRSNERREVGFLADTRRINVAITRAKRHVAVIGDSDCVSADPFIRGLLDYISSHGEHRSALEYIPAHEAIPTSVPSVDAAESEVPTVMTERSTAAAPAKKGGAAGKDAVRDKSRQTKQPVRQQQQHLAEQSQAQQQQTVELAASPAVTDAQIKDAMLAMRSSDAVFSSDVMVDDEPLVASMGNGWMAFTRHLKPGQRRLVHELATEYQLEHQSTGQGLARRILVRRRPSPQSPTTTDDQGQATTATVESEALVGAASIFEAMLAHSDEEEEDEDEEEEKEDAKAGVEVEKATQEAQSLAQGNATLRQLHEERMQRAAAKAVPAPQQASAASQEQKTGGKKNKKKGKGSQKQDTPELDEDALLAAAILENQRAADRAKYRISSEALPNPDKVRTKNALSSKLAAQANARLSKAAAEAKANGESKPRATRLSKPPRKVPASGQLSR